MLFISLFAYNKHKTNIAYIVREARVPSPQTYKLI